MPSVSPLADLLNSWAAQADDSRKLGGIASAIQQYGMPGQQGQQTPQPAPQQPGGSCRTCSVSRAVNLRRKAAGSSRRCWVSAVDRSRSNQPVHRSTCNPPPRLRNSPLFLNRPVA